MKLGRAAMSVPTNESSRDIRPGKQLRYVEEGNGIVVAAHRLSSVYHNVGEVSNDATSVDLRKRRRSARLVTKREKDDILTDPISHEIMKDPVTLIDSGVTYDKESLCNYIRTNPNSKRCPYSRKELDPGQEKILYVPNLLIRKYLTDTHGEGAYQPYDDSDIQQLYNLKESHSEEPKNKSFAARSETKGYMDEVVVTVEYLEQAILDSQDEFSATTTEIEDAERAVAPILDGASKPSSKRKRRKTTKTMKGSSPTTPKLPKPKAKAGVKAPHGIKSTPSKETHFSGRTAPPSLRFSPKGNVKDNRVYVDKVIAQDIIIDGRGQTDNPDLCAIISSYNTDDTKDGKAARKISREIVRSKTEGRRFLVPCKPPSHTKNDEEEAVQQYYLPSEVDAFKMILKILRDTNRTFIRKDEIEDDDVKFGNEFKDDPHRGNEYLRAGTQRYADKFKAYGKKTSEKRELAKMVATGYVKGRGLKAVPGKPNSFGILHHDEVRDYVSRRLHEHAKQTKEKRKQRGENKEEEEEKMEEAQEEQDSNNFDNVIDDERSPKQNKKQKRS